MFSIRRNVFETNSSSVHSITICTEDEFDKWQKNELFFTDSWRGDKFVTKECLCEKLGVSDITDEMAQENGFDNIDDWLLDSEDAYTYSRYFNDYYLETYDESFITEHGDKIVAFGKYGHD